MILTLALADLAHERQARAVQWLAESPGRRPAVLSAGLGAELDLPEAVTRVTVPVSCACCGGATWVRVALLRLLRQQRPDQILLLLPQGQHRPDRLGEILDVAVRAGAELRLPASLTCRSGPGSDPSLNPTNAVVP